MPVINKAMLMTAGLGTRLRPFTELKTKALLPLFGIPVVQFSVDSLVKFGVTQFVANVYHDFERTRKGLLGLDWMNTRFNLSDESQELLGSAGGIRKALPALIPGPFFLANADVISDINWTNLAKCHQKLRELYDVELTLGIYRGEGIPGFQEEGPRGIDALYREIILDEKKERIISLGEKKANCTFYSGAAVLEVSALKDVPQVGPADFVTSILEPAIRRGKAGAFVWEGIWEDIGSPKLWRDAHLKLMDRAETGDFPSVASRTWKDRIEKENLRIGNHLWIGRGMPYPHGVSSWSAPIYLNSSESGFPEVSIGPRIVLYGNPVQNREESGEQLHLANGIGYGGLWVSC